MSTDKCSVTVFSGPLFHTGVMTPLVRLRIWPTCNYIKLNVEKTALIMGLDVQKRTAMHKQKNLQEHHKSSLCSLSLTHLLFSFSCCRLHLLARSLKGGHCVPDSRDLQYFHWILLFSVEPLTLCLDYLTLLHWKSCWKWLLCDCCVIFQGMVQERKTAFATRVVRIMISISSLKCTKRWGKKTATQVSNCFIFLNNPSDGEGF